MATPRLAPVETAAVCAALFVAGLGIAVMSDPQPRRVEPEFRWDLYEESLANPLIQIRYADHPEYFTKGEVVEPQAGAPSLRGFLAWLRALLSN